MTFSLPKQTKWYTLSCHLNLALSAAQHGKNLENDILGTRQVSQNLLNALNFIEEEGIHNSRSLPIPKNNLPILEGHYESGVPINCIDSLEFSTRVVNYLADKRAKTEYITDAYIQLLKGCRQVVENILRSPKERVEFNADAVKAYKDLICSF